MKNAIDAAIKMALSQEGIREVGVNRGPRVEAYLKSVGIGPGNPWCAAFVYWCLDKAAQEIGVINNFIRTGYSPTIGSWAREHEILFDEPEKGDVFLRRGTVGSVSRFCHTGFVTDVDFAAFKTVEGNTNIAGSREGIGVFRRKRYYSSAFRFVRWASLWQGEAGAKPPTFELWLSDKKIIEMPVKDGRALCPLNVWAKALGFSLTWNQEEQVALLDGHEVPTETVLLDKVSYAPVRDLVEAAGLRLSVDSKKKRVAVMR